MDSKEPSVKCVSESIGKRQWKKWTPAQRAMFNAMHEAMGDQKLVAHPKHIVVSDDQWATVQHNAAYHAASYLPLALEGKE